MAGNLPFSEKLETEIGPEERWFSAAAGACLVGYGLSRVSLRSLAAMAVGGYLVYRGSTGKCPLGNKLSNVSEQLNSGYQTLAERVQGFSGGCCTNENGAEACDVVDDIADGLDPIDEAAMESFPASDPPSHASGGSTHSPPIT